MASARQRSRVAGSKAAMVFLLALANRGRGAAPTLTARRAVQPNRAKPQDRRRIRDGAIPGRTPTRPYVEPQAGRSEPHSGADCSSSRPRVSGRRANRTLVRTTGAQIRAAAVAKLSRASVSRPNVMRPATAPRTPAATSQPATVARTLVGNNSEPRAPIAGA